ncbi:MAG: hypothetical protein WCU88_12170 [Elusimicrobiota bacterium]|jgi:sugar lactone lactonase YvrE
MLHSLLFLLFWGASAAWAATGDASLLIGRGRAFGDGGPAITAGLNLTWSVSASTDGSIYIGDYYNRSVRKVSASGIITTLTSSWVLASKVLYSGGYVYMATGGGARVSAAGGALEGVSFVPGDLTATDGNILYSISAGKLQRVQDPVSGSLTPLLDLPAGQDWKLLAHADGALFCFSTGTTVRYVLQDASSSTLPGAPWDGWAYRRAAAFDGTHLYVAQSYDFPSAPDDPADNLQQVRRYTLSNAEDIVWAGGTQGDRDGTGTSASFSFPKDIAYLNGRLYLADMFNHKIKTLDPATSRVDTVAGMGLPYASSTGYAWTQVLLNNPLNVTADSDGTIYVADTGSQRVLKASSDGTVRVLAGSGLAGDVDGIGTAARFRYPCHVAVDGEFLYVADFGTHKIRRIHKQSGEVTTLAGSGVGGFADGPLSSAQFRFPWGLFAQDGRIYVADTGNHVIREIDLALRTVRTLAGSPGTAGAADGIGSAAQFNYPRGLAVYGKYAYIADSLNHTIRRLDLQTLKVETVAGSLGVGGYVESPDPSSARFLQPWGVAWDPERLYVADAMNLRIRQIVQASSATSLLSGSGAWGDVNGSAAAAEFAYPQGLFSQSEIGRLLVADTFNHKIKGVVIPISSAPAVPLPPTDLTATALPGLTIRLDWARSPSTGVVEYRVYMATEGVAFDFYTAYSTVSASSDTFTAQGLIDGKLYRFIVRAATVQVEEKNTNEASARAFDVLVCPAAFIKSPKNGKKVSGQSVTLMAGFADGENDSPVQRVLFQYRSILSGSFADVPASNPQHPNPDLSRPFFVHWDVSDLTNGEYYVRALSDCGGGYPPQAAVISLHVDHSNPDCDEENSGGEQRRSETIANYKVNSVVVGDPTAQQSLQVDLPAGAVSASTDTLSMSLKHQSSLAGIGPSMLARAELSLGSGQHALNLPAQLTFTYDPAATAGIAASEMRIAWLDTASGRWTPLSSTLDASAHTVRAQTSHFSTFGLLSGVLAGGTDIGFGEVYAFPNPAVRSNPVIHAETTASELKIRIYDKSGAKVHDATVQGPTGLIDDGHGPEWAYEYTWDVSGVAPDVYFFFVEARSPGLEPVRKTGRLAVVR